MKSTLGDKLLELRVRRKLSQTYISRMLDIPQTTYSGYERNATEPSFETIEKIARFYGVSPLSLLPFEVDTDDSKIFELADTLNRNPKLRLLFDRAQHLPESSLDAVISVTDAIVGEHDNE